MVESLDIALSLLTLTILEIVLGIDNLIFLAIISQRLPKHLQSKARKIGLTLAWVTRLCLLAMGVWLIKLTRPLFEIFGLAFSGRDLFLIAGGLFLLAKATQEIHNEIEPDVENKGFSTKATSSFGFIVTQIALLDIVFSFDSVLTAIGLTQRYWIMVISITIAIIAMIFASEPLSRFVEKHPTIKMLALSFLILIGMVLLADGFEVHMPRAYIYFAMGFSLFVEMLNLIKRKKYKEN